ncbi:hypothetical protein EYF80_002629 [Liparis tanakae]|uniref:Uncharacterized protein n=1 Tax=Liparis tanakae TaxID=230148 RepID=A0A4Z2JAN9_9TELE|nr:hypothetical protein EYF80_002629 [Liparis tanakae]
MSVSNIWLQVWAMKSRCFAATASFRQVELLQLTSSYVLGDVIHQFTLRALMGHGFIQFTGHQGLRHGFFSTLPKKQRHLLPLHQHRPQHQLVEGELESTDLRVIHSGNGEEVVNIDPVLKEQFDKVHSVEHQSVHHGLLQRVHLRGGEDDKGKPTGHRGALRPHVHQDAGSQSNTPWVFYDICGARSDLRVLIFCREMCFSSSRRSLTSEPYFPQVPLSVRMKWEWLLLSTASLLRGFAIV